MNEMSIKNTSLWGKHALLSYTSGKHMANLTSTADGSFFTIFTSPPMYLAGCWTVNKISSFNANFLMNAYFTCFFLMYGRNKTARF